MTIKHDINNNLKEKVISFYIESMQGIDLEWLLNKYGLSGMFTFPKGDNSSDMLQKISPINIDGHKILTMLKNIDPQDIVLARKLQKLNIKGVRNVNKCNSP